MSNVVWEYEDNNVWYPYDTTATKNIEAAYQTSNTGSYTYTAGNGQTYKITFSDMKQENVKTRFKRSVRRTALSVQPIFQSSISVSSSKKEEEITIEEEEEDVQEIPKIDEQDEVLELNVGGEHLTTMRSTLRKAKGSKLADMFAPNAQFDKDKEGRIFIDRPPEPFIKILNALRTGRKLQVPEDDIEYNNLLREIKYFGLEKHFKKDLEGGKFIGSVILDASQMAILHKWLGKKGKNYKCLYRASKDGFSSSVFRAKCVNKGATITIIKSTSGAIFGGYSPIPWETTSGYKYHQGAWLFTLAGNSANDKPKQLFQIAGKNTIYNNYNYGPTFGGGHDIYVCNNSNVTSGSYTNLGHSFSLPGYTYGTTQIKNYLAKSYNFMTSEIEVYQVE